MIVMKTSPQLVVWLKKKSDFVIRTSFKKMKSNILKQILAFSFEIFAYFALP